LRNPVQRDAATQRNGTLPPGVSEPFQPQFLGMRNITHPEAVLGYLSESDGRFAFDSVTTSPVRKVPAQSC